VGIEPTTFGLKAHVKPISCIARKSRRHRENATSTEPKCPSTLCGNMLTSAQLGFVEWHEMAQAGETDLSSPWRGRSSRQGPSDAGPPCGQRTTLAKANLQTPPPSPIVDDAPWLYTALVAVHHARHVAAIQQIAPEPCQCPVLTARTLQLVTSSQCRGLRITVTQHLVWRTKSGG